MKRTALLLLFLTACAHKAPYEQGLALIEAGQTEAGVTKLEEATRRAPNNKGYRQTYYRQRDIALHRFLTLAESARQRGEFDAAESAYKRMLVIDPGNRRALAGLDQVAMDRRHRATLAQAEEMFKTGRGQEAEARVRNVLAENPTNREAQQLLRRLEESALRVAASPQLSAVLRMPVTLDFRDGTLRQIFDAISKSTGLNFVFDRDFRPDARSTIFVRNSSVDDVLRFILVTNQLERKVLSENTFLIYPNTAAKARDYQELVVRSFYLTNVDAKTAANTIRSMVKTKDLIVDDRLNLVVMRDTPDAIRMAERLVANQDLAEPEVMLDVEVLEVNSNVLYELGIRYPTSLSVSVVGAAGTPGTFTLSEWQNRNSDMVRLTVTDPLFALNLRNELGRANLLASPRIRVRNRDKARVHIGDKLPVITTTTTATGFAAESVSYLDVGLKLEVEPNVFLDDEVGMKVNLEVSNVAQQIRTNSGALTYQVGTRNAATALRLKDGETQILAGLISDEDRKTASQVPGLGDLPIVGRLFGSHLDTQTKTEIVLLITPRILRNVTRPEARLTEFPSGTEAAIGAPPLLLASTAATLTPAAAPASPTPPPGAPKPVAPAVLLSSPGNVPAGEEFTVTVSLDSPVAVRKSQLELVYDATRMKFVRAAPGALLANDKDAAISANASDELGRLTLGVAGKTDLKGQGEIAKITFQVLPSGAGRPTLRIESLALTDADGKELAARTAAPLTFSISR